MQRVRLCGRAQHRQLALRVFRIVPRGTQQRAARGELCDEQLDAFVFRLRGIFGSRLNGFEQFRDGAFMNRGILAQIEAR